MMKKHSTLALVALVATVIAGGALAAEGGNPKKGKYLYKKHCKACHSAGAEAPELTPLSKTMKQWDRYFKRNKHKHNPDAWQALSDQEKLDINQFLFDHALDSDQPQTCG
ncbi:c-type cytochrome [Ferrimonas lipolytica]|uniref:Cytochrome c n=1 Tax=Ferrimonas lipolytica TaxID=2724191 RepID=A0A6H1UFS1_9GAMM|nr:cytochrome c [Ferrimonas lipolytica]QIZ77931.1 cytochrome c [Ferrimonas lipolytica]